MSVQRPSPVGECHGEKYAIMISAAADENATTISSCWSARTFTTVRISRCPALIAAMSVCRSTGAKYQIVLTDSQGEQ